MDAYWYDWQDAISLFINENITWFIVLLALVVLDILSKLIVVILNHDFSSKALREGLGHKLSYLIVLCVVAIIQVAMFDKYFTLDFDFPMFTIVCGFIAFLEFTSILENVCYLNPKLDRLVGKYLAQSNPYYYDDSPIDIIEPNYESDIDYTIKEE